MVLDDERVRELDPESSPTLPRKGVEIADQLELHDDVEPVPGHQVPGDRADLTGRTAVERRDGDRAGDLGRECVVPPRGKRRGDLRSESLDRLGGVSEPVDAGGHRGRRDAGEVVADGEVEHVWTGIGPEEGG